MGSDCATATPLPSSGLGIATISLSSAGRALLRSAYPTSRSAYVAPHSSRVQRHLRRSLQDALHEEDAQILQQVALGQIPALLLKGFPEDVDVPPTPGRSVQDHGGSLSSEYNALATAVNLGVPVAYVEQKDGVMIHNIVPRSGQEMVMSNEGSKAVFNYHTENNYQPAEVRCDYVILACKRQDKEQKAKTNVVVIDDGPNGVLRDKRLKPHISTLYQPEFYSKMIGFQSTKEMAAPSKPHPLLSGPPGRAPSVFMDEQMVESCSPAGKEALKVFREVINDPAYCNGILLQPGEVFVINNRCCLHGRDAFQATYGPDDRWLQRIHVLQNLWGARGFAVDGKPWLLHGAR